MFETETKTNSINLRDLHDRQTDEKESIFCEKIWFGVSAVKIVSIWLSSGFNGLII